MKHFQLKTLVLVLLAFAGQHVVAYDCVVDDIYYNLIKSKGTAKVTYKSAHYNSNSGSWETIESYSGSVEIPESITYGGKTYSVTSIGASAFESSSGLTSISIPNSVTSIDMKAFKDCSGLKSITIPKSVKLIDYDAFKNCSGLTSVHISDLLAWCKIIFDSTFSNPLYYAHHLFLNGQEVKDLVIPNSVTSIGAYAFYCCSGLTSVTIPNSVTTISYSAFLLCTGLTSVNIPNSVTSIGSGAFSCCSGLTSVTIPNSVTSIGDNAFTFCSGLTEIVVTSGNTVYDSRYNCNAIIQTKDNTLIIGCQNTVIPNSVMRIGGSAFSGCFGLTSINIPKSVTSIDRDAFYGCSGLTKIVVASANTVYDSRENCNAIIRTKDNTLITGCQNTVIPNSVTNIGWSAFGGCSSLTSIDIPNSVNRIDENAFWACSGLTSITIPNSVTYIGSLAFGSCSDLSEIKSLIEEPFAVECWRVTNKDIPLYVPKGTKELYQSTEGWKDFSNIIEIEETGIDLLTPDAALKRNGNKTALGIYTLQGMKVADDVERLKELPRGIYVVNGKKVAVK